MEFSIKAIIKNDAETIFNAWLDSDGHTSMTGGEAECTDNIGGKFNAWDGYITGENIAIEPHLRIVQSWRTSEFKENEDDSQIEILFEKIPEGTEITLNHTNIPGDGSNYIQGWEEHYFNPMKVYFE